MSRRPILLQPGPEPGSVILDRGSTSTPVAADGEDVGDRRTFSAAELTRGVVLLVGRVVLLLHRMPIRPSEEVGREIRLLGESEAVIRLRREINRLAPLDVPVLLRGATGTGKDLAARALHEAGPRRDRPFVAVNMAAVPPSLAAAELFGVRRGAYTGAHRSKVGFFQHADGGTLFLDEIGETPPEVQPMLLRALETQEILPVGGVESARVDVRVVAATDTPLEGAIAARRFRAPLFHRLAGYTVHLPPLAERRDDVGRLFHAFLREELDKLGGDTLLDDPAHPWPPAMVVAQLACYDWPGNVRELRNVARWTAIAGRDLPPGGIAAHLEQILDGTARAKRSTEPSPAEAKPSRRKTLVVRRRKYRQPSEIGEEELLEALRKNRFELKATATELGVSRTNIYRMVEQSPSVRKAKDLERAEIGEALARHGGDPTAAAAELEVSLRALRRRMTTLAAHTFSSTEYGASNAHRLQARKVGSPDNVRT